MVQSPDQGPNLGNMPRNLLLFFFRFMAKTCDGCEKKIIDETLIATNSGKHFHKDCYDNGQQV